MPPEQNVDEVRARFGATAGLVADHAAQQVETVREQLVTFVAPRGDERAVPRHSSVVALPWVSSCFSSCSERSR